LINEYMVKDNLALDFIMEVCVTFKQEKGISNLIATLKKACLDNRLVEFFPFNRRTPDMIRSLFEEKGLGEIITFQQFQASQTVYSSI